MDYRKCHSVFIHVPKTGGKSISAAWSKLGVLCQGHLGKDRLEKKFEDGYLEKRFVFSIVRNPWDKVVSHYHYRVQTNQTGLQERPIEFREWVVRAYGEKDAYYYDKPKMFMPQIDWIADENGRILVDEIIRFENLNSDFNMLLQKLEKKTTLPHVKRSNRGSYQQYYDPETIEIVHKWFERDLELFNYQF